MSTRPHLHLALAVLPLLTTFVGGCSPAPLPPRRLPSVAPASQPSARLSLNPEPQIKPMYRELLAVDLPTLVRVAGARSIDVQQARQRVESSRGNYQASVGAIFPVISPGVSYQHVDGVNQNANGTLVATAFNNVVPAATVQWIVNPGRVVYDIVAAKRRVEAAEHQERATELETLRTVSVQYYDLVLTQAKVAVAQQAVAGAEESLRITRARLSAGAGLHADDLRARAFLAARRQDLLLAVNAFYQASVALTVTLHLDATVTLVPRSKDISQQTLVRNDLSIEQMLAMAVQYRPDLEAARTLVAAARADRKAVLWSALGPNLQAAYTVGGIGTQVSNEWSGVQGQQRGSAGAGLALNPAAIGQAKSAGVGVRSAVLDVERRLDQVRAQVVSAQQAGLTNAALIPIAHEQVDAADEALRLARENLNIGTLLLVDVLQAEDSLNNARLRYAEAVARYNQAQVNLVAALGLGELPRVLPSSTQPIRK